MVCASLHVIVNPEFSQSEVCAYSVATWCVHHCMSLSTLNSASQKCVHTAWLHGVCITACHCQPWIQPVRSVCIQHGYMVCASLHVIVNPEFSQSEVCAYSVATWCVHHCMSLSTLNSATWKCVLLCVYRGARLAGHLGRRVWTDQVTNTCCRCAVPPHTTPKLCR